MSRSEGDQPVIALPYPLLRRCPSISPALHYCQCAKDAGDHGPIVTVRGGIVQSVHSIDPELDVDVLDWDNAASNEEAKQEAESLEPETGEMHEVF